MISWLRIFKAPSIDSTKAFYNDLVSGDASRGLWGKDSRFDPLKLGESRNIDRHFLANIKPYITNADHVLDLGCGSGVFLVRLAGLCRRIVGVDITRAFVDMARDAIATLGLVNAEAEEIDGQRLDFGDAQFDKVLMVDVIHHLENIEQTMNEVRRVLKPGGKLLIFEPNKLNPALFAMCVLDRNEWGLLPLGTRRAYERVLAPHFRIERYCFCGLLIGPDSRLAFSIADFLLTSPWSRLLGFLSPKLFVVASRL